MSNDHKKELEGVIDQTREVLKTAKETLKGGPGSGFHGHGGRPGERGGSASSGETRGDGREGAAEATRASVAGEAKQMATMFLQASTVRYDRASKLVSEFNQSEDPKKLTPVIEAVEDSIRQNSDFATKHKISARKYGAKMREAARHLEDVKRFAQLTTPLTETQLKIARDAGIDAYSAADEAATNIARALIGK